MSQLFRSRRSLAWLMALCVFACFSLAAGTAAAETSYDQRRDAFLEHAAGQTLRRGHNPDTWVDTERWSIAHAMLHRGENLDQANEYLAGVRWVSLSHGLVADTDVQVTDLLRTWFEFSETDRLSQPAKRHLRGMFEQWDTPNKDRNRTARERYTWPHEYTENHTFSILVAGYLIDAALERDREKSCALLQQFLVDRAKWGWAEFYSTRYGMVTSKTLVLLIDFAPDESVRQTATALMDAMAIDYAAHGLHYWRGMPANRGASHVGSNARNAILQLARLWFGDPDPGATWAGDPMLTHFLTSTYRPSEVATAIAAELASRPTWSGTQTATTGPAKQRVPIAMYVTPTVTMTAVQGFGSFYEGSYVSISFASSPHHVIHSLYGREHNNFQHENVLATFGEVQWNGLLKAPRANDAQGDEKPTSIWVGLDGGAWVGQIDLSDQCHVIMVGTSGEYGDQAEFEEALAGLGASFDEGVVAWTAPGGSRVEMHNTGVGDRWRFSHATVDGQRVRVDENMLFDSPWLRSVRGSMVFEILHDGMLTTWDLRDPAGPTKTARKAKAFDPLPATKIDGALEGMELLYIPPGEFPMGSPLSEGRANERPMRWVNVDGFYISKYETTIGHWKQFLKENPNIEKLPDWYWTDWGKTYGRPWRDEEHIDRYSITWVNWEQANAFCAWLSNKTGDTYRLPTEAEWEKAAKGWEHRAYPWGDRYDGTQSGSPNETYFAVGSKPMDVSVFDVMDVAGNTWEWCGDWYAADAYATADDENPTGPAAGDARVIRSCGWNFDPDTFRVSYRTAMDPDERTVHIGFRVVKEID